MLIASYYKLSWFWCANDMTAFSSHCFYVYFGEWVVVMTKFEKNPQPIHKNIFMLT